MTEQQLYLAIGVPSTVALIGILVNVGYFVALNGRMTALEARVNKLGDDVAPLKTLMDIVLKKLDEIDTRLHK